MGTILRDISLVWTLLHCCFMFMLLYESRYTARKTNILTCIFIVPLIIINMMIVIFLGTEKAGQLVVFACVLPSLIFFLIMARNRDTRFLFTFCLVDTVILEVLFASNILDTVLGLGHYLVMFLFRLISFPLLELCLVKYLRQPYQLLQQQMKKGWGVFSIMAMLFYAVMLLSTYHPFIITERPEYYPHLILLLILIPVMYMTVFKLLWTQLQLFNAAEKNRILDMQVKMTSERLTASAESEKRLQVLRHDMRHKMLLLNDYIRNENYAAVEQYINSMIADIAQTAPQIYCNNHSVNVVLSYYSKIADEQGITFSASVCLPAALKINQTDLAVVLSNGLENAINAQACCDDKKVLIKGFIEAGKICLEIKNPFSGSVAFDGALPCSKQEHHGFGTKSMAAIIEKYDGIYSFSVDNGYFCFRCIM